MINFLKEKQSLKGYTVILPSVGVGNVAQLTTDLLIASLKMEKVATCWHQAIVPLIGPRAFAHDTDSTTTACELYVCATKKIAILQMRTPLVATLMQNFFNHLVGFFVDEKISLLIILTSSYAYEKHTISATPFEYVANRMFTERIKPGIDERQWNAFDGSLIYGGGYANALLAVATNNQLPTIALFKYVSEGDNTPDATQFVGQLNCWLNVLPLDDEGGLKKAAIKLIVPISWKYLYGDAPPDQIY